MFVFLFFFVGLCLFFCLDTLRSLQAFQLFRFASLMVVSVVFANLLADKALIGYYEKLLLIGSVSTSFWVSGIIYSFLPYFQKHQPLAAARSDVQYYGTAFFAFSHYLHYSLCAAERNRPFPP